MAKAVSDDELQLKKRARRRLIGAVAIVTVVAVGLPMVLDSEPKPTAQDISIQIPSPDAADPKGKAMPLTPGAAAVKPVETTVAAGKAIESQGSPATKEGARVAAAPVTQLAPSKAAEPAKKPEPAKPAEKPVPVRKAEPAKTVEKASVKAETKVAVDKPKVTAEKPKAAPEKAKTTEGQYVVQVAALADADRAKTLHRKVVDAGMKAYTEVVQTANGPVTRVRVGPYPSRQAAEKARAGLKKLDLDGKVVPR